MDKKGCTVLVIKLIVLIVIQVWFIKTYIDYSFLRILLWPAVVSLIFIFIGDARKGWLHNLLNGLRGVIAAYSVLILWVVLLDFYENQQ